jgi:hypothetical protein
MALAMEIASKHARCGLRAGCDTPCDIVAERFDAALGTCVWLSVLSGTHDSPETKRRKGLPLQRISPEKTALALRSSTNGLFIAML